MRSMTGFGRGEITLANTQYTIEIKSVNHRYLDLRFRLPAQLSSLELPMTEALRNHVERGSLEVGVRSRIPSAVTSITGATRFIVDEQAAESLWKGCQWLHKQWNIPLPSSPEVFALSNRVFVAVEETQDAAALWKDLRPAFETALQDLKKMRETEGGRLQKILKDAGDELKRLTQEIGVLAPEQPKKAREKLEARLAQWKLGSEIDKQRLEMEVAILADRSDITEEIDRLGMHTKEFDTMLKAEKGIGRKLEFLTQELHREVNTIGSKTTLLEITKLVVQAKATIEKLREQVQNVE